MSDAEGDISIGVEIKLVGASSRAISQVNQFATTLRTINSLYAEFASVLGRANRGQLRIGNTIVEVNELLRQSGFDLDNVEEQTKDLKIANDALAESLRTMTIGIRMNQTQWAALRTQIQTTFATMEGMDERLTALTSSLNVYRESGHLSYGAAREVAKGFSLAGAKIGVDFVVALDQASGSTGELITNIRRMQGIMQQTRLTSSSLFELYRMNAGNVENLALKYGNLYENARRVNTALLLMKGTLGPEGLALKMYGQSLFWAGLGGMFFFMSLQRVHRQMLNVKVSTLGIVTAQIRYNDALEQRNKLYRAGLTNTKQYRDAQVSLWQAELQAEMAETKLRDSIQQRMFAYVQLGLGTMPTLIRATLDLSRVQMFSNIVQDMGTASSTKLAAGQMTLAGSSYVAAGGINTVNRALLKTIALSAVATGGITLLIGGISGMIATRQMNARLEETNRKMQELGLTLHKRGSPPMYDIFGEMAKQAEHLGKTTIALSGGTGNLSGAISGAYRGGGSTVINIYGPFQIRSQRDIEALGSNIVKKLRNRGAPV